jgi:plastocyanin
MRRLLLLAAIPIALAIAAPATAATEISITNSGFTPNPATVGAGDEVTWTNTDSVRHRVVGDSGAFSSPPLMPGAKWTFRFDRAGTFTYRDEMNAAERGTVVVRPTSTRSVTISATQRQVTLGSSIELSGDISAGAGQQVVIVAEPYRGAETRTPVITESDGAWSIRVRPRIRTEYHAEWGQTTSAQSPIVYVRPAVQLRVLRASTGRFYTKVVATRSYRGKLVTVQRLRGSTWVKVKRVRLGVGSAARFTAQLPRTARVRVLVPSAPGYLQGFSRTALVRR